MTIGDTVTREGIVVVVGLLLLFPTTVRDIMGWNIVGLVSTL